MKLNSLGYNIKEGFRNIWYNKLMSFASIGVLTACLVLVGSAMLLSLNISGVLEKVKEQNEIVVYLKDEITPQEKNDFEQELKNNSIVIDEEIRYISKEQALDEFVMGREGGDLLKEEFQKQNVFPASYRIKINNLEQIQSFMNSLESKSFVEKTLAPTQLADQLIRIDKAIKFAAGAAIIVLVLISLVIVQNTIRISVFSRRREINIMKYVGATNGFIRLPFMVEGAVLGLFSAGLSFGIIFLAYNKILETMLSSKSFSFLANMVAPRLTFGDIGLQLLLVFVGFGMITGIFGSLLSTRKHLNV